MEFIRIRGARTHNLQNVDLDLPRGRLVVVTGLSGSGKSSLAFDTLYAEGQRRYVESLSAYARQFLSVMEKPDVDHIEGLSPAIAIEQKSTSHNPRSTVGTITEIYDYLRLLFARAGEPRCPDHDVPLSAQTVSQIVDRVLTEPEGERMMLLAPVVEGRRGEHAQVIEGLRAQGYVRVRIDGEVLAIEDVPDLERYRKHDVEAVVDRFRVRDDQQVRLAESVETALGLGAGRVRAAWIDHPDREPLVFSALYACPLCGYSIPELEPRMFSFNNPAGACKTCDGLGVRTFFDPARIVGHPELSLPAGAVRGWDRRNAYYFQQLQALAAHFKFDLNAPFQELPDNVRDMILQGSGDEVVETTFRSERYSSHTRRRPFEGVIPNMERRYKETESSVVREELAKFLGTRACDSCEGARLNQHARCVFVGDVNIPIVSAMPVGEARRFFDDLSLEGTRGEIASKVVKEISQRLGFLCDVGLDYMALDRSAGSLSGGEAQRIRLASQIGAGLVGVMYILDEPSIGLHQRDNRRLLDTLTALRDMGNTVIVVEHDADAILSADYVVDMGPGAGVHGGQVVAQGTPESICADAASLTGQYLSGRRCIQVPESRAPFDAKRVLRISGARGNNLCGIDVELPVGLMTCVTGVSGLGKSTLINDTLYAVAARELNDAGTDPAPHDAMEGLGHFDRVVDIDQSPIGRTPRSNPATYTGLFTPIRDLFAAVPEARARGYGPGRFSFNVKGGRCEACSGDGVIKVEMHFLPDVYVDCDVCKGRRYNRETLEIRYKGRTIHEVLDMTIEDATSFFAPVPVIKRKLDTLMDVGLGYVRLGQRATTLSGGEAQRVKLARELSKRDTGSTLYILDEPTTGLHFRDIEQLLKVLHRLRDHGNTVVVIEHNLDVIKTADWIVDLGPEGGDGGGQIVVCGTPEQVAASEGSHTGRFLAATLGVPNINSPGPDRPIPGRQFHDGRNIMSVLICGSVAYDNIMVFKDRFKNHILPDKVHVLSVSFLVPEMRKEFGGCAGNIAYNLKLLGGDPVPMATVGRDFGRYGKWIDRWDIPRRHVTIVDDEFTAQAFITTDLDDNQITAFHPGAMSYSHLNEVSEADDVTIGIVSPDGRDGMVKHAEQFAEAGISFIFDPSQGLPMFEAEDLRRFIEQATWVTVNDYEWELVAERTGMSKDQVQEQVEALIITKGAKGSEIHSKGTVVEIPAAKPSQTADPTGCGDAHRAGLLYGLTHGMDWETTGRIASLMGAIKIESYGTQNHAFEMDEFESRFEESFGRSI